MKREALLILLMLTLIGGHPASNPSLKIGPLPILSAMYTGDCK